MRTDKTGDAGGRARWRSSLVGDPGAIFSGGKRGPGAKQEKLGEIFLWLLFLPSGASRSGPQRSRARRSLARRERTLDGEDRCESIGAGGKDLLSGMQDRCHHGGSQDE